MAKVYDIFGNFEDWLELLRGFSEIVDETKKVFDVTQEYLANFKKESELVQSKLI